MEQSLKNRLTYGPMMLAALFLLLWLDSYAQHWTKLHHPEWRANGVGGVGLMIILCFIIPIATVELTTLFAAEQVRPYRSVSIIGAGLLVVHAFITQFERFRPIAASTLAFIVVFVPLFAALRRAIKRETSEAIVRMAGTVLATLYLGGLAWFLVAIRVKSGSRFTGSTASLLMLLLVVKSTDIGAYFGGRALGRHKLIPWLSPGKTWEGLACGMLTSGLVGMAFAPLVYRAFGGDQHTYWGKAFLFGIIVGGIGQAGDLLESLMKRDAGVKDSGQLVPGFGGVLDIIDSPLFAAPFAYLCFSFF
jgi:phosphatidate cytidylyltransferase